MKKHRLLLLVALLAGLPCIYGATRDSLFISVEKYTSNSIQKYTIIGKNPIVESISWDIPTY
jgi:hypothetical protein